MARFAAVSLAIPLLLGVAACGPHQTPGGNAGADARSGGDDDDGGGGGGGGPDADCPAVHFTPTQVTPSITLLIDQSGSMRDDFSGGMGGESKYQAEHDALVGAMGVVGALQDKVYFGATLYTTSNDNSVCPKLTGTPRAIDNLANIQSLIEANGPGANTPTPQAITAAVADFALNAPPAGSPPIIVLSTDGLPNNCAGTQTETQASVDAAAGAYAAGVKLFMLSVGDAVTDAHAQAMANAGAGVQPGDPDAPFFKGDDPASLADAFQQVISSAISCDLTVDGTVDANQAQLGTVTLDGVTLTYGTDWTLSSPTTITLLGTACDTLKTATSPVVDASFPCGVAIP